MRHNQTDIPGMSVIVKAITKLTAGFIFLYGIYIVIHGHVSPGGGFAGGVIIALSFIQLILAFGKEKAFRGPSGIVVPVIESIGAVVFLSIAILGFLGGYFFYDFFVSKGEPFDLFSGGTIPLSNIAIAFKVSLGLFAIFIVLILLKVTRKKNP